MTTVFIGTLGAALVLLAYLLSEMKVWSDESVPYDLLNILGSALLVAYAWLLSSVPFIVLNAAWMLLSLRDLIRDSRRSTVS